MALGGKLALEKAVGPASGRLEVILHKTINMSDNAKLIQE